MNLVHILQPTPFFLIKENLLCTEKILAYIHYISQQITAFSAMYISVSYSLTLIILSYLTPSFAGPLLLP